MGNPEGRRPAYLRQVARRLGWGEETEIDLPSDEAGVFPTRRGAPGEINKHVRSGALVSRQRSCT
jgi:hypothetical protein